MTPKEALADLFRTGIPIEKLGGEAVEAFVSLIDTITNEEAQALLDRAAYETAQMLLVLSATNLVERIDQQREMN